MATTEQDKIIEGCGVLTWFDANKEYIKCGTEIGFPNDYLLCSKCEIRKEVNKALQSQNQKIIEEIKKCADHRGIINKDELLNSLGEKEQ